MRRQLHRLPADLGLNPPLISLLVVLALAVILLQGCAAPAAEYVPKTPRQTLLWGYGLVESLSQDVALARMNQQITAEQQVEMLGKLRTAKQLLDDAKIGLGASDSASSPVTGALQAAISILTTLQQSMPPPQPAPVPMPPPEGASL